MEGEKVLIDFKGYSIGYEHDEKADTYEWFTVEPSPAEKQPFRMTFEGEWAAQAARVRFMNNIESLFNRYFKKIFAELGIDPGSGRRIPNDNTVGKLQGSGSGQAEQGIQSVQG